MFTRINTFKDWDYPNIAKKYEAYFNIEKPKAEICGIVCYMDDELLQIIQTIEDAIKDKIETIWIDLFHIEGSFLYLDIITYATAILETNGYVDLGSSENKLSYGKLFKEECE